MRFIYFLKTRATYIILFIMCVICIGALFIAGRMTVIAYKKQSQEIGSPQVVSSVNMTHPKAKLPNLKTLNEISLYFNGRRIDGLLAFSTSKGEALFPLDDLLNFIGIDYIYHTADGIIETSINDSNIMLKIGSDTINVNGLEKPLPFAVVLANDRIMVPVEVLNSINGFSASEKPYLSSTYVNYNPDYMAEDFRNVYYVAANKDTEGIYSINRERYINVVDVSENSGYQYSPAKKAVLYFKNEQAYLLGKELDFTPIKLDLGQLAQWTEDKKAIYEASYDFNTLKVYSPDSGKIRTFKNIRDIIASNEDFDDFITGELKLVSYWSYDRTTRIVVRNTKTDNECTIVYNKDKPIILAKAWLSPTGRYMAYIENGEYRICAFDGELDVAVRNTIAVRWVTDEVIMLLRNGEWKAYNVDGTIREYEDNNLKYLGKMNDDIILFRDSKSIYKSVNGMEEKITDVDVKVDAAVATPELYSIIAGDKAKNALYLISGSITKRIGDYSSLLRSLGESGMEVDINRSVKVSPDGKSVCMVLLGKDTVTLRVMSANGSWSKDIRLDSNAYMVTQYGKSDVEYMNDSKIVFYDNDYIWLIDLDNKEPEVTRLPNSDDNAYIKGVMVN